MSACCIKRSTLLIACLILFSVFASAQQSENTFYINPRVGLYLFEGDQNLEPGFTLGASAGRNFTRNFSAEFSFDFLDTETRQSAMDVNGYLYKLDLLYHFRPDEKLVPYFAAGLGGLTLDPAKAEINSYFVANYGLGVKYFFTEKVALRSEVRHVLAFDDTYQSILYGDSLENNLHFNLGLEFILGGESRPKASAAPAPVVESDSDGDGVYDSMDKCPNTPAGVKVDASGCPLDSDGDGVYDYQDKCPNTPKGVKVDASGCPLDSDGDGVYDYQDKCPDTPRDLKVDSTGCPILMKSKESIRLDILFDTDKANIKPEYDNQLNKVADFMAKYPETKAEIDGHTDSIGSASYNQKLSQRRADSVRDYLIKNFSIAPERLTAKGFGEEQPVASNDTKEGRSQNRRIEAVFSAESEYYEKK
jgi:OOP family OmpA-OmpF porin